MVMSFRTIHRGYHSTKESKTAKSQKTTISMHPTSIHRISHGGISRLRLHSRLQSNNFGGWCGIIFHRLNLELYQLSSCSLNSLKGVLKRVLDIGRERLKEKSTSLFETHNLQKCWSSS